MQKLILILIILYSLFGVILYPQAQYSPPNTDYIVEENYFDDLITNFDVDIVINNDRSLNIVENIEIYNANAGTIQRGIYRDFPVLYRTKFGFKDLVNIEVKSVKRDGVSEPYIIEGISGGKRIRIGDANYFLPVGKYVYTIEYTIDKQIRSFSQNDELYFNLVGTEWEFGIKQIYAQIHFPVGITKDNLKVTGYSGIKGSIGSDFKYEFDESKRILRVNSTKQYGPKEGLTISAVFPKGYVNSVSFFDEFSELLIENGLSLLALLFAVCLSIYYFLTWYFKGRDKKLKTVIPLFEPPKNLSPAQIRYLDRLGFDNKVLTTSILNAAIKRYWNIIEDKHKKFELQKIGKDTNLLSSEEALIASSFFNTEYSNVLLKKNFSFKFLGFEFNKNYDGIGGVGDKFKLDSVNSTYIQSAISKCKQLLDKEIGKKYIQSNLKTYLLGFIFYLVICSLVLLEAFLLNNIDSMGSLWSLFFWNGIVSIFIFGVMIPGWIQFIKTREGLLGTISITLFLIPFECAGIFLIWLAFTEGVSLITMLALFIPIPLFVVFYKALKARNIEGVELQNQIDGFKIFLKATESQQLKFFNKQLPHTFETYQKYLPFAVALDLETQWTEKFDNEIKLYAQNNDNSIGWYSGSMLAFSSSNFASSLSSSISSSISSSSSSGSSGGSSGGGGGGGGGGGW